MSAHDQDSLQNDLNKLAAWEQCWKMSFHPQKCTTVHMTTSRTTAEREYQLHDHKLQEETQVKYLGVTLKKDLKWEPHTTSISSQANRSLGFLRRNVKVATLEKVQRRAARWVSHRYRQTSSVEGMLQVLDWPTLRARRKRARLTTF
ncbi:hypothetical protein ACOMHN_031023 [Nucella lapillus]